ncbi:MAG TPA: DNA translocase FtsK 4TM domain-containing protein [Clostridiaceae bacterium]
MKKKESSIKYFDIKGIILIFLGLFIFWSILSSSTSGIMGDFIRKSLIALMGLGSYIFPLILIFVGLCYIFKKGKLSFHQKFYGMLLFLVNSLILIQIVNIKYYYINGNVFEGVKKIYSATSSLHGGIFCYLLSIPIFMLLGKTGSYILIIAIYFIAFILFSEISISDILSKFKPIKKNKGVKKETLEDNVILKQSLDEDKKGFLKNLNSKIKIIDFLKSSDLEDKESIITNGSEKKIEDKDLDKINEELVIEIEKSASLDNVSYEFPSIDLLNFNNSIKLNKEDKKDLVNSASKLEETLFSFGVDAKVVQVTKGPSVTRFELQPSPGVKVSKIVNLSDDIALNLAASSVRIEAPIPGKSAVGIELPNKELSPVLLREVVESLEFMNSKANIAVCLGKDISGNCVVTDLAKMPHLLIAGATGSGKSVCINTLIISILYKYTPEEVRLLMIDPKVVELNVYNGIPHLLIPVVTNPKKAAGALNWAVNEMERRYKVFAENNVRNIESYNDLYNKKVIEEKLSYITIIIDELADLMTVCPGEVEEYIGRLAQMARAAGMHLVIATQRPSVDVITGVIKANIPSRISFSVSSQIDSRTILDMAGAEKLLGKGDMLFNPMGGTKPIRIQGAFISEEEVENVVKFIKGKKETKAVSYDDKIISQIESSVAVSDDSDELIEEAIKIVIDLGQASTSLLQRKLRIGYNRAARIMELLEDRGVISSKDGSKPRQILVSKNTIEN